MQFNIPHSNYQTSENAINKAFGKSCQRIFKLIKKTQIRFKIKKRKLLGF
jgi:hypothetical protein